MRIYDKSQMSLNGNNASVLGAQDPHEYRIHAHFPHWLLLLLTMSYIIPNIKLQWTKRNTFNNNTFRMKGSPSEAYTTNDAATTKSATEPEMIKACWIAFSVINRKYSKQFRVLMFGTVRLGINVAELFPCAWPFLQCEEYGYFCSFFWFLLFLCYMYAVCVSVCVCCSERNHINRNCERIEWINITLWLV